MSADFGRALRTWLVARVALATVVLGLVIGFFLPSDLPTTTVTPIVLGSTVLVAIASSFGIALWLQRDGFRPRIGHVLMVIDVALVTAVVSMTGGAGSVLAVLYGAIIVGAATTLGPRASFLAAGLSLAAYAVVGMGMATGYLPHPSDQPVGQYVLPLEDLAFSALSNVTEMVVVALLSSWLADQLKRTGGELQRSERSRLELSALNEDIVRSIGAGLLTLDAEDRITSINPAGAMLLSVRSEDALGLTIDTYFPSLEVERDERSETTGRNADGRTFPAGYTLTSLRDASGVPSGRLLSFQDLTEIRALEKAAREAEQLATLGRVAAGLAHEIRNPLGSISGSVELVREHAALDEEDRHLLGIVLTEVERLDDLVHAMLNVARPRRASLTRFDLAEVANDVAKLVSTGLATAAGATVTTELPPGCPVVADTDMIRQILWNLLKNAVQCAGPGATVELHVQRLPAAGFQIEIRDDGPGIPEAERERIFDAFHSGRTRGVGLGLTLVRQLVEAHGGKIAALGREPRGSVFRIEIPELQA